MNTFSKKRKTYDPQHVAIYMLCIKKSNKLTTDEVLKENKLIL